MVKAAESLKGESLELKAKDRLEELLGRVPFVRISEWHRERSGADFELELDVRGQPHRLVCEAKSSGQPRFIRDAILQLSEYGSARPSTFSEPVKVIAAPFLSAEARDLCRKHNVCYVDLEGNSWLHFDGVYIETTSPTNSRPERRELRSAFAPKSAQVLHAMLREPERFWRLTDLARAAHVSLGHVSNVKQALLDREWAYADEHGLRIARPRQLLDVWRETYEPPAGEPLTFYTSLHGKLLERQLAIALSEANDSGNAMLYSYSAANYLTPYARHPSTYVYADRRALSALRESLQLREVEAGENVVIFIPENRGIFLEKVSPIVGVACTGPVQTYLDLWIAGERGREAADHLRRHLLNWSD